MITWPNGAAARICPSPRSCWGGSARGNCFAPLLFHLQNETINGIRKPKGMPCKWVLVFMKRPYDCFTDVGKKHQRPNELSNATDLNYFFNAHKISDLLMHFSLSHLMRHTDCCIFQEWLVNEEAHSRTHTPRSISQFTLNAGNSRHILFLCVINFNQINKSLSIQSHKAITWPQWLIHALSHLLLTFIKKPKHSNATRRDRMVGCLETLIASETHSPHWSRCKMFKWQWHVMRFATESKRHSPFSINLIAAFYYTHITFQPYFDAH